MKRRDLVALALVAPIARSAKLFPLRAPQIRVFADLKHTGRLAGPVNGRAITDADFGIAVPLPSVAADAELLGQDSEKQEIASRLGLLRIESSEPRTPIVVSVAGEGVSALRVYRKTPCENDESSGGARRIGWFDRTLFGRAAGFCRDAR